jgi:hypothetical protein
VRDPRISSAILWIWLSTSALLGWWFAWVAVSGIVHPMRLASGNLVLFAPGAGWSSTIYPFTYAGVALSLLGVGYFVLRQEGPSLSAFVLASLAAYVSSVGMLNVYEQGFVLGVEASTHSTAFWAFYWGTPSSFVWTVVGMTWVLAAFPWWQRYNWRLVVPLLGLYLTSMATWYVFGFPGTDSGATWVYAVNAVSRISSQLVLVALVVPEAVSRRWVARFLAITRRPRAAGRRVGTSTAPRVGTR